MAPCGIGASAQRADGDRPRLVVQGGKLFGVDRRLRGRVPGTTTVDALAGLLVSFVPDEQAALRKRVVGNNGALRIGERARFGRVEELLA
jgi:hypothetical protein